jgi:predicted nucleic acid-binding protein
MIALDACVLIAFVDPADAHHEAARRILTTTEPLMITALTGAELMVRPTRPGWQWSDLLRELGITIESITADDMTAIAQTRRDSGLKMPDALVVWVAHTHGATLASFDQHLCAKATAWGVATISA